MMLLAQSCFLFESNVDKNSGGDHVRGKAKAIEFDITHDDHISAPDGDHTDWKSFSLPDAALIEIHAYWDDPSVTATINIRDQFGGRIFELKHARGKREDHWRDIRMRDGQYFLEVVAKRGASVYTLELKEASSNLDAPGGMMDTAPPE